MFTITLNNTTDSTCGTVTAHSSETPDFKSNSDCYPVGQLSFSVFVHVESFSLGIMFVSMYIDLRYFLLHLWYPVFFPFKVIFLTLLNLKHIAI